MSVIKWLKMTSKRKRHKICKMKKRKWKVKNIISRSQKEWEEASKMRFKQNNIKLKHEDISGEGWEDSKLNETKESFKNKTMKKKKKQEKKWRRSNEEDSLNKVGKWKWLRKPNINEDVIRCKAEMWMRGEWI